MSSFSCSILSPTGIAYEGQADYVSAPGIAGGLGILANHAPMIAAIHAGLTTIKLEGKTHLFYTGNGVLEVKREETVLLVENAQSVETAEQVKELLAKAASATNGREPA